MRVIFHLLLFSPVPSQWGFSLRFCDRCLMTRDRPTPLGAEKEDSSLSMWQRNLSRDPSVLISATTRDNRLYLIFQEIREIRQRRFWSRNNGKFPNSNFDEIRTKDTTSSRPKRRDRDRREFSREHLSNSDKLDARIAVRCSITRIKLSHRLEDGNGEGWADLTRKDTISIYRCREVYRL